MKHRGGKKEKKKKSSSRRMTSNIVARTVGAVISSMQEVGITGAALPANNFSYKRLKEEMREKIGQRMRRGE